MSHLDFIRTRASALTLGSPGPDTASLNALFECAITAPDHGRLRPWRFVVIEGDARQKFGQVLADSLRRRRPEAPEELLAREAEKALRAPTVIVVVARYNQQAKIPIIEQMLSAGAAAQNIMLASKALGFDAMWKTGDAAYDDEVKKALGFEPDAAIVGFIYVGSAIRTPPPRTLPPLTELVTRWTAPA